MAEFIATIIVGLATGFVASYLFWRYLYHREPSLTLSTAVVKRRSVFDTSKFIYQIGLINTAKRPVINLRYFARLVRVHRVGNHKRPIGREVPLSRDFAFILGPVNRMEPRDYHLVTLRIDDGQFAEKLSKDFPKRVASGSQFALEDLLDLHDYLRFQVMCTDAESNVTKVFERRYTRANVVEGEFVPGSLVVVRTSGGQTEPVVGNAEA